MHRQLFHLFHTFEGFLVQIGPIQKKNLVKANRIYQPSCDQKSQRKTAYTEQTIYFLNQQTHPGRPFNPYQYLSITMRPLSITVVAVNPCPCFLHLPWHEQNLFVFWNQLESFPHRCLPLSSAPVSNFFTLMTETWRKPWRDLFLALQDEFQLQILCNILLRLQTLSYYHLEMQCSTTQ